MHGTTLQSVPKEAVLSEAGQVVQSSCSQCEVVVHWKATEDGSAWEPLDAPSGFVCDHWRDHHEAIGQARVSRSGQALAGFVSAELLTKPRGHGLQAAASR